MFNPKLFFVKKIIKRYQAKAQWENIPRARAGFEKLSNRIPSHHADVDYKTFLINDLKAEWVLPKNATDKNVLLYFHGGGYAVGSPNTHRALVSEIALEANVNVLLVDYRLAPEYKFPAPLEDALMAYNWLLENNYQPDNIAFGGDSAGGGLCFATLLYLRDNKMPLPKCAIALSPWTDLTLSNPSHQTKKEIEPMLLPQAFPLWVKNYVGDADPKLPYASPLFGDLEGLPPIYIQVGSDEILLDDSVLFVQKAKAAGVSVTLDIYKGYFHVFQSFFKYLGEARRANKKLGEFLKENLK